ncbi:MAG: methyltransferase domain-containing protein [Deltaproteobacteria bacterium]|nr:methyltransferase domain-containing protein [Deltaproteobacteria bacterium]
MAGRQHLRAELARGAEHVVGVDLQFAAVRRARRLLAGERVAYNRRIVGAHYRAAHAAAGDLAVPEERATLLCSDALDPPLVPGAFDRVVALNLIDSVARPRTLFAVLDGLCAPGGEILVASPYAWASATLDDGERIGGADPAAAVRAHFESRYAVEDEDEIPWTLRREARVAVAYTCHYLRLRKR